VQAYEAAMEMANAIGAYGWANLIRVERLNFDEGAPPEVAIPQLRDLLARIRPAHMFSAFASMMATYQLVRQLARRNAPGDVEEAFALGRAREKIEGRAVPVQVLSVVPFPAIADGRPKDGARLFGYAEAAIETRNIRFAEVRKLSEAARRELLECLSEAELATLMAEGARLTPEQHFVLAMKLEG
jgi:hypothetical protein